MIFCGDKTDVGGGGVGVGGGCPPPGSTSDGGERSWGGSRINT